VTDLAVVVSENVALGDDLLPRDFGVLRLERSRHQPSRLADDFNSPLYGKLQLAVLSVLVESKISSKVAHGSSGIEHVPDIPRVSILRPHRRLVWT